MLFQKLEDNSAFYITKFTESEKNELLRLFPRLEIDSSGQYIICAKWGNKFTTKMMTAYFQSIQNFANRDSLPDMMPAHEAGHMYLDEKSGCYTCKESPIISTSEDKILTKDSSLKFFSLFT